MDTIKVYLENMFSSLPKTEEIERIKDELGQTMEDKYQQLKAEGKSENEAIGIVISEFGNIDELKEELGINDKPEPTEEGEMPKRRIIGMEEAHRCQREVGRLYNMISVAIMLCILSPAVLVFLGTIGGTLGDKTVVILGLVPMFILIAIAVTMFIIAGTGMDKFAFLKEEIFELAPGVHDVIQREKDNATMRITVGIAAGVVLCIMSPIPLIIMAVVANGDALMGAGVAVLLVMNALGVFTIVQSGTRKDSYDMLLQTSDYSTLKKARAMSAKKLIDQIASIYWPFMVVIYLGWSFIADAWGHSWIIWPIAGVAFGLISAVITAIKGNKIEE